ncbi:hypothetical protein Tco_0409341, partial [Tanacetum coccineum]
FLQRPTAKGIGLRVADSHTGNHLKDDFTPLETIRRVYSVFGRRSHLGFEWETSEPKGRVRHQAPQSNVMYASIIALLSTINLHQKSKTMSQATTIRIKYLTHLLLGMSAKNTLAIQRCELSRKELDEFLSFYPIPLEYRVILPTPTQTILDAPPGYIGLYTYCFSFANLRLPLNDFFCEAYDCEPSVELFRSFFNLCKADTIVPSTFPQLLLKENMLDVKSFKDKSLMVLSKTHKMSFRNFIYIGDDEDLTFRPKDFSLGFNTGSPSVSINTEPVRTDKEPTVEPTTEPVNEHVGDYNRFRGEKLASSSSTSRTVRAKASTMKDDTHVLSISDDDEGLKDCLEQTVVDDAVNRRSRELLMVIKKLRGEADVMRARELAREEECEGLRAKCEAAMTDFDKNPTVLAYKQVARMMEPFDLSKVKRYRPSYEKEHTQANNDLATATFPWLIEYIVDASAFVEALLSKKPPTLQKHVPSRTQMPVPSSQLATPSFAPSLKPMSPPADIVKPSPPPNE